MSQGYTLYQEMIGTRSHTQAIQPQVWNLKNCTAAMQTLLRFVKIFFSEEVHFQIEFEAIEKIDSFQ